MMPPMHSAYRRFYSTETAVTKVYNDLLLAADAGQVSVLCLLDLTAAFDTVDHQLLLHRLERHFGLHAVLSWLGSRHIWPADPFGSDCDTNKYDRSARWTSLAWCVRKGNIQAGRHESWCTAVCTVKHIVTSLIISFQPPKLFLVFVCAPLTDTSSSFLVVDSAPTTVGLVRLRARRSGTRYQTNSEIRRVVLIVLDSCLRQSFFGIYWCDQRIRGVLNGMHYINPLFTYLLTLL